jgi:hypothetical protein
VVQSANTIVLIFYVWSGIGLHDIRYILLLTGFTAFTIPAIGTNSADAGLITS